MKEKLYLCFDIGATTTKFAYINSLSLKIINRGFFQTKQNNKFNKRFFLKRFLETVDRFFEYAKKENLKVLGIGIATCGGVDTHSKKVIFANNTMKGYVGTDFKTILSKYKVKIAVENDVKAAGIYEFSKVKSSSGLMITLGTGYGACLFINGQIYYGFKHLAGEVGQMIWPFDNKLTFDTACSAVIATNKISKIIKDSSFKLSEINKIQKNKKALLIKQEWINNVTWSLKFLNYFYDPEIFIIGGGVSKHSDLIYEIISNLPKTFKKILLASKCNDAAFFGLIQILEFNLNNKTPN